MANANPLVCDGSSLSHPSNSTSEVVAGFLHRLPELPNNKVNKAITHLNSLLIPSSVLVSLSSCNPSTAVLVKDHSQSGWCSRDPELSVVYLCLVQQQPLPPATEEVEKRKKKNSQIHVTPFLFPCRIHQDNASQKVVVPVSCGWC